ncbi:hypothetical protein N7D90_24455 (plasmid) [Pseudomonas fragi]|nr:hypothetical protein [Pseudomonas fragi]UXL41085.1 hypothetical protein N7D90_24455 [Pseudomonas fragi]
MSMIDAFDAALIELAMVTRAALKAAYAELAAAEGYPARYS